MINRTQFSQPNIKSFSWINYILIITSFTRYNNVIIKLLPCVTEPLLSKTWLLTINHKIANRDHIIYPRSLVT